MKLLRRVMFAFLVLFLTTSLVSADDDPPGRVARLQYMTGSVSIQPRGTEDWVAGSVNRPLTTSDNIWADKDSRAELNVGTGVLRVNGETSLSLTNISDNTVQVQLHQGTLNLRVRKLYRGEIYEVDTPNIAFTVQKSGEYRFDVGASGDVTLVTVRKGEGDATGDGPAVRVRSNQRARFSGGTSLAHETYEAPGLDGFDDWCRVRDRREGSYYSARYVSPGVIGYEDLDAYGSWRVVPTYGAVWVPALVGRGWAPYRYGHWVWVSPWGWTWVDDAPWGFAPFHYGRWVYAGYWAWSPGPVYVRPIYAPALVAWFGGPRFGVGLSFGNGYGWCPLGYGEPFVPWYRGSRHYFRNVNITNTRITNITYVTNNYYNHGGGPRRETPRLANLQAPGGVTAVPQHAIVNSLPVAREAVPLSAKEARSLASDRLGAKMDIPATRASMLGANAGRPTATPPEKTFARPVVSRITPPASPVRMPKEVAELDKADRPMAAPKMEKSAPVAAPASGRNIPRPPLREVREDNPKMNGAAMATRSVAKPPTTGAAPEARESHSGAMHSVPRPPENNRSAGDRPTGDRATGTPNSRISRSDNTETADRGPSATPATRPVPRPPASESRRDTSGDSDRAPSASPAMRSVPQAAANDNRPKSSEGDSNRGSRPSDNSARSASSDVPRPSGPVAPSQSDQAGPRSAPRESSPSQGGGSPRSYGGPSQSSAPPSSAPPRESSPSQSGGSPRSNGGPSQSSAPPPSASAPSHGASQGGSAPSSRGSSSPSGAPAPKGGKDK